jgi:hypothetical protein
MKLTVGFTKVLVSGRRDDLANFTVRIELHKAVGSDYDSLHAAMEHVDFSRLITGDNGQTYHMPWAEYTGSGPQQRAGA